MYFEQNRCHDFHFPAIFLQQNFCHLPWLVTSDQFFPFSDNVWLCLEPAWLPALSTATVLEDFVSSGSSDTFVPLKACFKLGYRLIAAVPFSSLSGFPLLHWAFSVALGKGVGNGKSSGWLEQDRRATGWFEGVTL